jgi:16S rRNA (uracil1498-N3)-methyltransferase
VYVPRLDGTTVVLEEGEGRHLAKVLRKKTGEGVVLFDGKGSTCAAAVRSLAPSVTLECVEERRHWPQPRRVTLLQALPNDPSVVDDVVRATAELGVWEIIPLFAARTERIRWTEDALRRRRRRWEHIVVEACKQSHNPFCPSLGEPRELSAFVERRDVRVVCGFDAPAQALPEFLSRVAPRAAIAVAVGPEGGWTADEMSLFEERGCAAVSLAPNVLRVATAATLAVGMSIDHRYAFRPSPDSKGGLPGVRGVGRRVPNAINLESSP